MKENLLSKLSNKCNSIFRKTGFKELLPEKTQINEFIYGTIEVDSTKTKYLKNIDSLGDDITDFPDKFKPTIIEGNKVVVEIGYWGTDKPIHEAFKNTKNIKGGIFDNSFYPLSGKIFKSLDNILYLIMYYVLTMFAIMISSSSYKEVLLANNKPLPELISYIPLIPFLLIGVYRITFLSKKHKNLFELYKRAFTNFGVIATILTLSLSFSILLLEPINCALVNVILYLLVAIYCFTHLGKRITNAKAKLKEEKEQFDTDLNDETEKFKHGTITSNETNNEPVKKLKRIQGVTCSDISFAFTGKKPNSFTATIRYRFNNGKNNPKKPILKPAGIGSEGGKNALKVYKLTPAKEIVINEYYDKSKLMNKSIKSVKELEKLLDLAEKTYEVLA